MEGEELHVVSPEQWLADRKHGNTLRVHALDLGTKKSSVAITSFLFDQENKECVVLSTLYEEQVRTEVAMLSKLSRYFSSMPSDQKVLDVTLIDDSFGGSGLGTILWRNVSHMLPPATTEWRQERYISIRINIRIFLHGVELLDSTTVKISNKYAHTGTTADVTGASDLKQRRGDRLARETPTTDKPTNHNFYRIQKELVYPLYYLDKHTPLRDGTTFVRHVQVTKAESPCQSHKPRVRKTTMLAVAVSLVAILALSPFRLWW